MWELGLEDGILGIAGAGGSRHVHEGDAGGEVDTLGVGPVVAGQAGAVEQLVCQSPEPGDQQFSYPWRN